MENEGEAVRRAVRIDGLVGEGGLPRLGRIHPLRPVRRTEAVTLVARELDLVLRQLGSMPVVVEVGEPGRFARPRRVEPQTAAGGGEHIRRPEGVAVHVEHGPFLHKDLSPAPVKQKRGRSPCRALHPSPQPIHDSLLPIHSLTRPSRHCTARPSPCCRPGRSRRRSSRPSPCCPCRCSGGRGGCSCGSASSRASDNAARSQRVSC